MCDSRSGREFLVAFGDRGALIQGMTENAHERTKRADGVLLLTMIEAARVLSIGRTTMYELVAAGQIDVVRIGRAVRVPVAELDDFVARQCRSRVIP